MLHDPSEGRIVPLWRSRASGATEERGMSYIDTFDHEFVGFFVGLPLYHPTETVSAKRHADEFGCTTGELVLGGGPGEYPALLVTDPGGAVLHFLHFWLE